MVGGTARRGRMSTSQHMSARERMRRRRGLSGGVSKKPLLALMFVLCCTAFAPAVATAAETGSITGTVTEAGSPNAPIQGIEVCAYGINGTEFGRCSFTDVDGGYEIPDLPEGEYEVEFTDPNCLAETCSPGWAKQYYDGAPSESERTPVPVKENTETPEIDASLQKTGVIDGTAENTAGETIADMPICAYSVTGGPFMPCTVTNSAGEYVFYDVTPGEFVVEFSGEVCTEETGCSHEACREETVACTRPYIPQFDEDERTLEEGTPRPLSEDGSLEVNETLSQGGKIEGTVTLAALDRLPLGGVKVCAQPEVEGILAECTKTNANGQYAVEGLATALNYQVKFGGEECTESGCSFSYFGQYFDGKASAFESEFISLTAPEVKTDVNASLTAVSQKQPASLTRPTLSGTPSIGETLGCSEGTWSNNPTAISYAWLRDGVAVASQNSSSYKVTNEDEGTSLTCEVTVANNAGLASAGSNALKVPSSESAAPKETPPAQTQTPPTQTPTPPTQTPTAQAKTGLAIAGGEANAVRIVTVTLTCTGEGACEGSLKLVYEEKSTSDKRDKRGKPKSTKVTIGTASYTIAAGGSGAVAVKLTPKGAVLVAKSGKHGLKVKLTGSGLKPRTLLVKLSGK